MNIQLMHPQNCKKLCIAIVLFFLPAVEFEEKKVLKSLDLRILPGQNIKKKEAFFRVH